MLQGNVERNYHWVLMYYLTVIPRLWLKSLFLCYSHFFFSILRHSVIMQITSTSVAKVVHWKSDYFKWRLYIHGYLLWNIVNACVIFVTWTPHCWTVHSSGIFFFWGGGGGGGGAGGGGEGTGGGGGSYFLLPVLIQISTQVMSTSLSFSKKLAAFSALFVTWNLHLLNQFIDN